jgi:hypothetical protein
MAAVRPLLAKRTGFAPKATPVARLRPDNLYSGDLEAKANPIELLWLITVCQDIMAASAYATEHKVMTRVIFYTYHISPFCVCMARCPA